MVFNQKIVLLIKKNSQNLFVKYSKVSRRKKLTCKLKQLFGTEHMKSNVLLFFVILSLIGFERG